MRIHCYFVLGAIGNLIRSHVYHITITFTLSRQCQESAFASHVSVSHNRIINSDAICWFILQVTICRYSSRLKTRKLVFMQMAKQMELRHKSWVHIRRRISAATWNNTEYLWFTLSEAQKGPPDQSVRFKVAGLNRIFYERRKSLRRR